MLKNILYIIICTIFTFLPGYSATTASQTITATLSRGGGGGGGGGGATGTGGIVAGGVVGGTAVSGATALAFAPILLAGLAPNPTVCAAAPLNCVKLNNHYLPVAVREHGINSPVGLDKCQCQNKFFFAQDDCEISNGTYDIDKIVLPENLRKSGRLKIKVTIASQPYGSFNGTPDFVLGIYKDIFRTDLNKKFESQQFLHNYLMKKYEIPLKITSKEYSKGIQKLTGVLDISTLEYPEQPFFVVVRYVQGGFHVNLWKQNPKTLTYAYLIEFIK